MHSVEQRLESHCLISHAHGALPLELFYQFALHLPSTTDVLAFSLTHSRVRKVLSIPELFKECLLLQGWDVSAWLEEDSAHGPLSPQGKLERWMRIDHVYCRTIQFFDEAAADNHFLGCLLDVNSDGDARKPEPDRPELEPSDNITSIHPWRHPTVRDPFLLGRKTVVWLRNLREVLPVFLTHHRAFWGAFLCSAVFNTCFSAFQAEETSCESPKQGIAVLS